MRVCGKAGVRVLGPPLDSVNVLDDSAVARTAGADAGPAGTGPAAPGSAVLDHEAGEDGVRGAPEGAPRRGRRWFGWHGLSRMRRVVAAVLLGLAVLVTTMGALLLIAAVMEDASINVKTGRATAEVVSVAFNRTVIRFDTPDGAVRIPPDGVLYPQGLEKGQLVRVEYDARNPDLVRIAGRGAWLVYLPVGSTVLGVWAVVLPTLWWLRRRPPRAG